MQLRKTLLVALMITLLPVAAQAQIVITEIMYNAASSEATNETQYVEIANITNSPVDLTGWEIGDSQDGDWNALPAVTLPARGIAVVFGSSLADFTNAFGPFSSNVTLISIGATMFNLSNSPSNVNETVAVRDGSMTLIDEVNYDDTAPWPTDPGGVSIYLAISEAQLQASGATLNDDGSNWAQAANGVDGAFTSTPSGIWDSAEIGSPGSFGGNDFVPVELMTFSID